MFRKLLILICALLIIALPARAAEVIKASPNYLVILVHGIASGKGAFEGEAGLKKSIEDTLGLKGYVYAYDFLNKRGSIIDNAAQLGNPTNYNYWVGRARRQFKESNPGKTIPEKVILICHSMGGLSARYYITSNYYQNDVKKLVTLDTPHLGSDMVTYLKKIGWGEVLDKIEIEHQRIVDMPMAKENYELFIRYQNGDILTTEEWAKITIIKPAIEAALKEFNAAKDKYLQESVGKYFNQLFSLDIGDQAGAMASDAVNGTIGLFTFNIKTLEQVYRDSAHWVVEAESPKISSGLFSWLNGNSLAPVGTKAVLKLAEDNWFSGDGFNQLDPNSEFINALKNAKPKPGADPISYRLVSASGAPTPKKELIEIYYQVNGGINILDAGALSVTTPPLNINAEMISNLSYFSADYYRLPNDSERYWALLMSMLYPGMMCVNNGSIVVAMGSSRGEGVEMFNSGNTKYYEVAFASERFENSISAVKLSYYACVLFYSASYALGAPISNQIFDIPMVMMTTFSLTSAAKDLSEDFSGKGDTKTPLANHILIPSVAGMRNAGKPSIIEQTIFDTPVINLSSLETDIDIPTFKAEQKIVHTTSLEGVEIRNLANAKKQGDWSKDVPLIIASAEVYLPNITVVLPPTQIKGVIYDFKPLDLEQLELSENFSAWHNFLDPKNIIEKTNEKLKAKVGKFTLEMDNWGRFTLSGLDICEGSNVLAFRLKNRIYDNHQIIRITLNSVPQYVSAPFPEQGAVTNNPYQPVGVEAHKACYTSDPIENIVVTSFEVDGVSRLAAANISASRSTYTAEAYVNWTPAEPFAEGEHNVLAKFQSVVGNSQALWSFKVDLTPPTITVASLEPFSPRIAKEAVLIKYTTTDNLSGYLNVSVGLYNHNGELVREIAKTDEQAVGPQYVEWDGKLSGGEYLPDGLYTIKVKAFDAAGNYGIGSAEVAIDSTPPVITAATFAPNPVTKAQASLSTFVSEPGALLIRLTNKSQKQVTAYFAKTEQDVNGANVAGYSWNGYPNKLTDGVYSIEAIVLDAAGNQSEPWVIDGIRVDQTPPVIFGQYADPFVLSNSGGDPYQTKLHYRLSESNDIDANKHPGQLEVKIKLFNENTGQLIWTKDAPAQADQENILSWDGSPTLYGKGGYKFQITAADDVGNTSITFAKCVKDGILPVISFPENGADLSGTVTIRGTAMDPDWTNGLGFKRYRLFYASGMRPATVSPGSDWESSQMEVPLINRGSTPNESIKQEQNDATLAYFHTTGLPEDDYTILLIVEEVGGAAYAAVRTVHVSASGGVTSQIVTVKLADLPSEINFNGNTLPIGFSYGGKDVNAYLELIRNDSGTAEVAYYKYYPKLTTTYYSGKPSYLSGNELGYFVWQDEAGWHVRLNGEAAKQHRFSGQLIANGSITSFNSIGSGVHQVSGAIDWDTNINGNEGGFDFKTNATQLIITTYLDDDPASQDDDFFALTKPFFGIAKVMAPTAPTVVSGLTGDVATRRSLVWDGREDNGAFVPSGNYLVRARVEACDGLGLATDEKPLKITTPFELTNLKINNSFFNPIGVPDRVTVSYNLSKDAHVYLKVYQPGQGDPIAVIDDGIKLGQVNPDVPHKLSWRGNYPDIDSSAFVAAGEYVLKLLAVAVDGSGTIEKELLPKVKVESGQFSPAVKLDPIGREIQIKR